ncbi:21212_t:CDS:2 [Dentiscutata erythropus]|uniref:21212_t:CDS:1 n=1 Tax=Dentiscutata erythropus TaxID=1348616 RepID=A0A9N9HU24_9GLOM|nr:21212_t:CDS:2 [Dentiscutata erythropus]
MSDPNYIFEPKRKDIKNEVHKTASQIPQYSIEYVKSLFPIFSWIGRYNTTWFIGDLIAGITIGLVVIPQSMAYAKVASLPVQYGLYSSFIGVTVYCLFATSKDMTIGPTAVVSLLMGQTLSTILKENKDYSNTRIAATFSLLTGLIILLIGLLRIGYIVRIVSNPVIAGFTTGSAINISISQVAGLLGITGVNTRDPTYLVLGNTLGNLGHSTIDASVGLTCLLLLYTIKFGMLYLSDRFPNAKRIFFITSTLRNFLVIVIYTLIAYLLNIGKSTNPLNILKTVPSGLNDVGARELNSEILGICGPYLPGICIVLILEHIAIAKSFGRINDYKVDASQECIAIGVTNVIGSFFGAYPATGSFSRSAIKAKSGVRTPLAGIFSGILVILALYALTPAFYYIPNASLSVEIGIYVSVGFSLVITLFRLSRPRFEILGRIAVASFNGLTSNKYAYVPLKAPFDDAQSPPSGILIFRLDRTFTYLNTDYVEDKIINYIKENTRRVTELPKSANELPWNQARNVYDEKITPNSELPLLKAIIFDFSAVHIVDSTAVQTLVDAKKAIKTYSGSDVEYHFANIHNESIQRSLIIAGFGSADQKASLIDIGTNTAENNDLESKSQETKISSEIKKSEEISEVVVDNSDTTTISKRNKFFHINLEEAVIAATNGTW